MSKHYCRINGLKIKKKIVRCRYFLEFRLPIISVSSAFDSVVSLVSSRESPDFVKLRRGKTRMNANWREFPLDCRGVFAVRHVSVAFWMGPFPGMKSNACPLP